MIGSAIPGACLAAAANASCTTLRTSASFRSERAASGRLPSAIAFAAARSLSAWALVMSPEPGLLEDRLGDLGRLLLDRLVDVLEHVGDVPVEWPKPGGPPWP